MLAFADYVSQPDFELLTGGLLGRAEKGGRPVKPVTTGVEHASRERDAAHGVIEGLLLDAFAPAGHVLSKV